MGDYDRAIADYTQAIRLDPGYANSYNKGDFDRAVADYEVVLRINPDHVNAKQWLEEARKQRGK